MTRPRLVLPRSYHHVTRRCISRRYLLRPDPDVVGLFVYCFAEGAERYGVETLRLTVMSNHYHAVLYDREGRLPEFLGWVHQAIARGIQRKWGLSGAVFEPSKSTGDQLLMSSSAIWKMMRYVHTNPISAQLVKRARDWPGLLTPAGIRSLKARRPDWMTERAGPETHRLRIHVPKVLLTENQSESFYHRALAAHDKDAAQEVRRELRCQGSYRFLGKDRAMKTHPSASPETRSRIRSCSPRFVAVTRAAVLASRGKIRAFLEAYYAALRSFRQGERDVLFPRGTWKMARTFACRAVAA